MKIDFKTWNKLLPSVRIISCPWILQCLLFHITTQNLYQWPWHKNCANGMCWFHPYWEASWVQKRENVGNRNSI